MNDVDEIITTESRPAFCIDETRRIAKTCQDLLAKAFGCAPCRVVVCPVRGEEVWSVGIIWLYSSEFFGPGADFPKNRSEISSFVNGFLQGWRLGSVDDCFKCGELIAPGEDMRRTNGRKLHAECFAEEMREMGYAQYNYTPPEE